MTMGVQGMLAVGSHVTRSVRVEAGACPGLREDASVAPRPIPPEAKTPTWPIGKAGWWGGEDGGHDGGGDSSGQGDLRDRRWLVPGPLAFQLRPLLRPEADGRGCAAGVQRRPAPARCGVADAPPCRHRE